MHVGWSIKSFMNLNFLHTPNLGSFAYFGFLCILSRGTMNQGGAHNKEEFLVMSLCLV